MRAHNHYRTTAHSFSANNNPMRLANRKSKNSTTNFSKLRFSVNFFPSIDSTMIQMMCTMSSRFKTIWYFILYFLCVDCVCRFFDSVRSRSCRWFGLLLLEIIRYFSFIFFLFGVLLSVYSLWHTIGHYQYFHAYTSRLCCVDTLCVHCTVYTPSPTRHTRALYHFLSSFRRRRFNGAKWASTTRFENQPFRIETAICIRVVRHLRWSNRDG